MLKVGMVFRSTKLQDGWNVWHEIMSIDKNKVTICNYGKTTKEENVVLTKKEFAYCLKKGIIVEA